MSMPEPLHTYFETRCKMADKTLNQLMDTTKSDPEIIHESMRYSVFAGGKRLRPVLVIAGAEICGGRPEKVLPTAAAMELIHTYSLVHDDLPAMDNDDLRRGRPTNHKVYGEAIAVLAGDGLLTKAFELIAGNAKIPGVRSEAVVDVITLVAKGAGTFGMIGGQVMDIQMEGGRWKKHAKGKADSHKEIEKMLRSIHRCKTAALIRTSLQAGARLANGTPQQISGLGVYGEKIGLAFQIADDVLDVTADKKKLGKNGSDSKNKKLTFPALYGLDESKRMALALVEEAKEALAPFERRAQVLKQLANYIVERDH